MGGSFGGPKTTPERPIDALQRSLIECKQVVTDLGILVNSLMNANWIQELTLRRLGFR